MVFLKTDRKIVNEKIVEEEEEEEKPEPYRIKYKSVYRRTREGKGYFVKILVGDLGEDVPF